MPILLVNARHYHCKSEKDLKINILKSHQLTVNSIINMFNSNIFVFMFILFLLNQSFESETFLIVQEKMVDMLHSRGLGCMCARCVTVRELVSWTFGMTTGVNLTIFFYTDTVNASSPVAAWMQYIQHMLGLTLQIMIGISTVVTNMNV